MLVAAVVLIPGGQPLLRLGAVLAGAAAAWLGFALRVGVLPDIALTTGLTLALAIVIVTAIAAVSAGRLPLWAGLAGIAGFTGVYEAAYRANPAAFLSESPVAFTTLLLAAAIGAAAGMVATVGAARTSTATTDTAVLAEETI